MASFGAFWLVDNKKIPSALFIISLSLGLIAKQISWIALPSMALIATCLYMFYHKTLKIYVRFSLFLVVLVITILLFLHKISGYNNWLIFGDVKLSDNSINFPFWFNFDKAIIGFFLLLFAYNPIRKRTEYIKMFDDKFIYFFTASILTMLTFGVLSSYLVFDPKIPDPQFLFLWLIKMLFFTVIVEELFFRFFIQNNLIKIFDKINHGKIMGLVLTATIFGLAHLSAGIIFVFLALISGLLYGGIYLRTKRLEAAIILHFTINLVHLIFFSYPAHI